MEADGIDLETMGQPRETLSTVDCFRMETKPYNRGGRIKAEREKRNLSLEALAAKIGSNKGTVSKWEKLVSPNIELDMFFALAEEFEIDPRELALGKPKTSPAIPEHRVGLIQRYGDLPADLRFHIRGLVDTLHAASLESYSKWSRERAEEVKRRPVRKPEKEALPDK